MRARRCGWARKPQVSKWGGGVRCRGPSLYLVQGSQTRRTIDTSNRKDAMHRTARTAPWVRNSLSPQRR